MTIMSHLRRMFCVKGQRCSNYVQSAIVTWTPYRHLFTSFNGKRNKIKSVDNNGVFETYNHGIRLATGVYKLDLPFVWLRDHCRSEQCFNLETFQRKNNETPSVTLSVPESVDFDNKLLKINWKDGHVSSYSIDWLINNAYHEQRKHVDRFLWNKELLSSVQAPIVQYGKYMETIDGLKTHLSNLVKYGVSIVSGVEQNHNGTVEVAKRTSHLMETFYGPSWKFTTNMSFKDTAYTTYALGAHTDNTYFSSPAGIQVFHVLEHNGEGGQTLLVDGFNAAENVRKKYPESFAVLCKHVIPYQYYDEERHIKTLGTVLTTHPSTKELAQIRFNTYDRAPLNTLSPDNVKNFYESYAHLNHEITNPENEYWIKLKPDMVLFVDNWRVLHGRAAFTGSRYVSGCYLPRDDWISRARIFGLLLKH